MKSLCAFHLLPFNFATIQICFITYAIRQSSVWSIQHLLVFLSAIWRCCWYLLSCLPFLGSVVVRLSHVVNGLFCFKLSIRNTRQPHIINGGICHLLQFLIHFFKACRIDIIYEALMLHMDWLSSKFSVKDNQRPEKVVGHAIYSNFCFIFLKAYEIDVSVVFHIYLLKF